jgi:hypothetical protein
MNLEQINEFTDSQGFVGIYHFLNREDFDKICDKLPNDSLKGYTQENIIEFKEFKKNLKSNI